MKRSSYLIILLLILSAIPAQQSIADLGDNTPIDSMSTSTVDTPTQVNSDQIQSGFSPQLQDTTNPVSRDEQKNNPFRTGQTRQLSSYQNTPKPQSIPSHLTLWTDLSQEIQRQGMTTSFTYADDAILAYDIKGVEYVIKTSTGKIGEDLAKVMQDYGVEIKKSYPNHNYHVVTVPLVSMEQFVKQATGLADVSLVEPNYYAQASYIPDDPEYINQYGPQIIGMETAWDINLGHTNVTVAVVDTGIDYNHPDLGNYLPIGYDHVNGDDDPYDDAGHGTHVAGTIAATINNALGVAGVANVSFFAEKFLDSSGYGSAADGAAAINHAVDMGADIISNSWGGSGYSQLIADAVAYAIASDIIVTAAAGNGATSDYHYPAAIPEVIAVSATNAADNLAGFSNYGEWIDIAAPGVDIISTVPGSSYAYYSGTSMATPHVSGLLALLIAEFPEYTTGQLEQLLYDSAVDLGPVGFDPEFGHGRIDASVAIYGIQEHDVAAELSAQHTVPNGEDIVLTYGVSNNGLSPESDVQVELKNGTGSIIDQFTVPFLNTSSSASQDYLISQPNLGEYHFSVFVTAVVNETVLHNNEVDTTVVVTDPVIYPSAGDLLMYGQYGDPYPFEFGWAILNDTDPTAVIVAEVYYDTEFDEIFIGAEYTLNTFTREFSGPWQLFPYWINPNVTIGDTIDLFSTGGQEGIVVGEATMDYYGFALDVWVVDDGYEIIYFSQSTGSLIRVEDYSGQPFIDTEYTNVHPEVEVHNQLISLVNPLRGSPGETTLIDVFVYNTGEFVENSFLTLHVDGEFINQTEINLNPFDWMTISLPYTPPSLGTYNISITLDVVPGEVLGEDNIINEPLHVVELNNYFRSYPAYQDFDAVSNGFNLDLYGDDVYTSVGLPFDFEYYDSVFDTIHISSNGWLSFAESAPRDFYSQPLPTSEHPYMVAPFFSDLQAEGNVYAWATPDFVVIEYVDYFYLWDDLVGTFEVVFFADGTILFQYESISYEDMVVKGLNYGLDLDYYTTVPDNLGGVTDFSVFFSLEEVTPPPSEDGPDLAAGLEYPILHPGDDAFITASASNTGNQLMQDVELYLYIDGQLVSRAYAQELPIGEQLVLNYLWTDMPYGDHLIEVEVVEKASEVNVHNNYISESVFVSDEHDLWVWMYITVEDDLIYLDALVFNQGFVDERDVELYILIDGQVVTFGSIDSLAVGTGAAISYVWQSPQPGTYNLTAFSPLIEPELNEENNQYTEIFTVEENNDLFVLQLFDSETFEAVPNAYVSLYSPELDFYINSRTNNSGGLTLEVPASDYYLYIEAQGYGTINTMITVSGVSFFEFFLESYNLSEELTIEVYDNETLNPVAGADVYIYGYNTGYYFYNTTDENGIFNTFVPEDEYDIQIDATGYVQYFDFVYVQGQVTLEVYLIPLVFDSQLVLRVLDGNTTEPLTEIEVSLFGFDTGYEITPVTNGSGIIDVELPTDTFEIFINTDGYELLVDTIYVDGFVYYTVYLNAIVLDSTIAMEIFDAETSEPISSADVYIYGLTTGFEYIDQTNGSGILEVDVPEDEYYISVTAIGYDRQEFQTYVSGFVYLEILLQPFTETYEMEILDPTEGQTVAGGRVYVNFETSSTVNARLIEIYVNGQYVTNTSDRGELFVPIFANGSNLIELVAYWHDGLATANVTVESVDVTPYITLVEGDYINMHLEYTDGSGRTAQFNFTYIGQYSEFEALFNLTLVRNNGDIVIEHYYLVVNILNGYIIESDMWWIHQNFFLVADLDEESPPTMLPFFTWSEVSRFANSTTFDGYDAYMYVNPYYEDVIYLSNGILAYMSSPGLYVVNVDTSILPDEDSPPEVSSPIDLTYEYGTSNHSITWQITTEVETYYNITVDGQTVITNELVNGSVTFNVDGLDVGTHEVTIILFDAAGHMVHDTVLITVEDTTPPTVNNPGTEYTAYENENVTVTFEVTDPHPGEYLLLLNESVVDEGNWTRDSIHYTFTNLTPGYYEVLLILVDQYGNQVNATAFITIQVLDVTAPEIDGQVDFTYEVNSTDNEIEWTVIEEHQATYEIYLNGIILTEGTVEEGFVELGIDGLEVGRYNFTIVVTDTFGNFDTDEVIVYVISVSTDNPTDPDKLNGFTTILVMLGLFVSVFTIRRRSQF